MDKNSKEYLSRQKHFEDLTEFKLSELPNSYGDWFSIYHDASQLDGFFTADELRLIADQMDEFKKWVKHV